MPEILIKGLVCSRCGYTWKQRTPNKPILCPRCKNPYWDKMKRNNFGV